MAKASGDTNCYLPNAGTEGGAEAGAAARQTTVTLRLSRPGRCCAVCTSGFDDGASSPPSRSSEGMTQKSAWFPAILTLRPPKAARNSELA